MSHNLNLKNIDDLIYLEGSSFNNVNSKDIENINNAYFLKLNTSKKQLKNNKSLFLYDYRPTLINFENPNWKKEDPTLLDNPAIQPHDSRIESISMIDGGVSIKGNGNSYMNYQEYAFEMNFDGLSELSLLESSYGELKKESVKEISIEDLNEKLSNLKFRELFLDQSATLKSEINLVFIEHNDSSDENEKRNIIVVKFEYDSAKVTCEHIQKQKKKFKTM